MALTVADVMRHINNIFDEGYIDGTFAISGDQLTVVPPYPWVCIQGSMMHDGVYRMQDGKLEGVGENLPDEEFTGRVWLLKPPPGFLRLCDEIIAYEAKNPTGALQSESFGSYSYTRGGSGTWMATFGPNLWMYRKPFAKVVI